jgi:hypothetical protein
MYTTPELEAHIKELYDTYFHTKDIDAKGGFYSPECRQICRPNPSFAATNSQQIVQYLHEYSPNKASSDDPESQGSYSIRLVKAHEFEFGLDEHVTPAGFSSSHDLRDQAVNEGWIGMNVDMFNDSGFKVKVHYWWRREGEQWLQILHDIQKIEGVEKRTEEGVEKATSD